MKINKEAVLRMCETQKKVDERILSTPDTTAPDMALLDLAFSTEMYEFFNTVGAWKWWKHNHQIVRERVLDELADCWAFFLSLINKLPEVPEEGENPTTTHDQSIDFLISSGDQFDEWIDVNLKENDKKDVLLGLIVLLGTSTEFNPGFHNNSISIVTLMSGCVNVAALALEDLTWEEVEAAYMKKSGVNIERQEHNY